MSARPTDPRERSIAIDALRGWALIGIAIVNVPWIGFRLSLPSLLWYDAERARLSAIDLASAAFVEALCEGRFYPIFSALFGFGTGLLLERSKAAYARRVAALFVFGGLHATFGWYGDVLLNYAAAGVVLALFARLGPRALFAIAALLLVVTQLASLALDDWFAPSADGYARTLEYAGEVERAYRDGSFASITAHRLEDLRSYFTGAWNVSYRLNVLAMATTGLAIERTGVHTRLEALRPWIGRLALALLALGLVLSLALVALPQVYLLAGDVLAGGYALAFVRIASAPAGARGAPPFAGRWARPFAAVGRTALTCYLGQTLAFTLFFYGYGLGMYGRLGPAQGIALAVSVYAVELVLATLWLRWFEHGPVEWLWRTLTYLRPPRMRRVAIDRPG